MSSIVLHATGEATPAALSTLLQTTLVTANATGKQGCSTGPLLCCWWLQAGCNIYCRVAYVTKLLALHTQALARHRTVVSPSRRDASKLLNTALARLQRCNLQPE